MQTYFTKKIGDEGHGNIFHFNRIFTVNGYRYHLSVRSQFGVSS